MDQKFSFKLKFEFVIDRYADVYNRLKLEGRLPRFCENYYQYVTCINLFYVSRIYK